MLPICPLCPSGKIDRVFVADLEHNDVDRKLACAIVAMGQSLGLQVIAEGIETPAQRDFLTTTGCDLLQGYLFSKPVPPDALARMLTVRPH